MLANLLFSTLRLQIGDIGNRLAFRLAGIIVFLTILYVPVFGQTDYSDGWLDDSNPDALYVVGVGVTDNDYGADAIGVETTLTSPNGRTVSGEADDYGSARVEVTLPWDWDDLGDYFVHTTHQPLCWGNWDGSLIYETRRGGQYFYHWNPGYSRCMASRETTSTLLTGISKAAYYESAGVNDRCFFDLIPGCNVTCSVSSVQDACDINQHYRARWEVWVKPPFVSRRCIGHARIIGYFEQPPCVDEPQ